MQGTAFEVEEVFWPVLEVVLVMSRLYERLEKEILRKGKESA